MAQFAGKGYDQRFARNMAEVKAALERGDSLRIRFACDDLCACCPHHSTAGCALGEGDVAEKDARAAHMLGVAADDAVQWEQVRKRMAALPPGSVERACQSCQWLALGCCGDEVLRRYAQGQSENA